MFLGFARASSWVELSLSSRGSAAPESKAIGEPNMETQADSSTPAQPLAPNLDRREHPRVSTEICCIAKTRTGMHEYMVTNLSVSGALLTGGPQLRERCPLIILLRMPDYPEVRIPARVVRTGVDADGNPTAGIQFVHRSDVTEDHIQAALLSELERSHSDGKISDVLDA